MLFQENLIYLVDKHLQILRILGSHPYKLDPHSKHLKFSKSHRKLSIKNWILFIIALTTWAQIWHGKRSRFPMGVILENSIYAAAETIFPIATYFYLQRHERITELFNMLIVIERKHLTEDCKFLL